jgi:preprotein translocase subunit SecB
MAEDNNAAKGNGASPTLNILAQYVKDLSFEGGAPNSLRARDKAEHQYRGQRRPIRCRRASSTWC